jgi:hypothetical protein
VTFLVDEAGAELVGIGAAPDGGPVVRFARHAGGSSDERVVAPAGEGLWHRSPWPAADALFELPAPALDRGVLVAGGSAAERAELLEAIGGRSLPVAAAELLTRDDLEAAAAVLLLPPEGANALPAEAPAVLAARRLLLVRSPSVDFGLVGGVHTLVFGDAEEAADHLQSARRVPYAYSSLRVWGRAAAERHRASRVYDALVAELALEGALG